MNPRYRPKQVKGVLFDLDGVLIDSARAWHRVISDNCLQGQAPSFEQFLQTFGQGPEADRRQYFPHLSLEQLQSIYERDFPACLHLVELKEGALPLLGELCSTGIRRAVVTNTPRGLAERVLALKQLESRIEVLAAAGDAAEKPAPDLIQLALKQLRLTPSDVLYVGDSASDRAATQAAGVFMLGLGIDGDGAIDQLHDIAEWI